MNREKKLAADRKYAAENRETARQRTALWRKNNKERQLQNNKNYYEKNKEKQLERAKKRNEKLREENCARSKQWRLDNRDKVLAQTAKRRADRKNATPSWADLTKIREYYTEAVRLSDETGIPHQVDHIVPLNGKEVCGLHVDYNLRVVTAEENNEKKNKLIEELL